MASTKAYLLAGALVIFCISFILEPDDDELPSVANATSKCPAVNGSRNATCEVLEGGIDNTTADLPRREGVAAPRGMTSPINEAQAQVVMRAFDKDGIAGLNVTELRRSLRVVSVLLDYNDVESLHLAFDIDQDEVINDMEFAALASSERKAVQRAWRMLLDKGWIFFFGMVVVQMLLISYVEGRQFNSVGAYQKYKEQKDNMKRAWDHARAEYLSPQEFWPRLRWYLVVLLMSFVGSFCVYLFLTATAMAEKRSQEYEMMWWFFAACALAPVAAYLALRIIDWIVAKKKRLLNKSRRSQQSCRAPRLAVGQENITMPVGATWDAHRMCIGGNKRKGRKSRSVLAQQNREAKAQQKVEYEKQKKALQGEVDKLREQLRKCGAGEVKKTLRTDLKTKEAELQSHLFQGDKADQKKAIGSDGRVGAWNRAQRAKQKARGNGQMSADVEELARVVNARVAEEIGNIEQQHNAQASVDNATEK